MPNKATSIFKKKVRLNIITYAKSVDVGDGYKRRVYLHGVK